MNVVYNKVVVFIQVLIIVSLFFLLTSAAKQKVNVCHLKSYCTQGRKASCCYEWPVHNFSKLATSNMVLHVSPGKYNLNSNIQITAVKNFIINGNDAKFICNNSKSGFYFSVINSSSIHIVNVKFIGCGQIIEHSTNSTKSAAVYLLDTSSVNMTNVVFQNNCGYGIIGINVVGETVFKNVNISQRNTNAYCHYQKQIQNGGIMWSYNRSVTQNTAIFSINGLNIHGITNNGNVSSSNSPVVSLILHNQKSIVNIHHVIIANVTSTNVPLVFISILSINTTVVNVSYNSYQNNNVSSVLNVINSDNSSVFVINLSNNSFYNNTIREYLVSFSNVTPLFDGFTLFESNKANVIMGFNKYMTLNQKAVVSFSYNRPSPLKQTFHRFIIERWDEASKECPLQVNSNRNLMYTSIKFCDNKGYFREVYVHSFLHNCIWNSKNITGEYSPVLETLYKYIIRTCENTTRTIKFGKENDICQCDSNNSCLVYKPPKPVYPGQSVAINLHYFRSSHNLLVDTKNDNNPFEDIAPTCDVLPKCDTLYYRCTKLSYSVELNATSSGKCLILLSTTKHLVYVLHITTSNCPTGFSLDSDGKCDCNPKLQNRLEGITCNISDETFKLPPNSWISTTNSNEIIYATYCKYGYCLQTPTRISLHTPDDQCLASRSGISCGQCKNGLSTMLGSRACRRCSNNGLFFIILFAVAGILLVLSLFVLNLTVANGDIYGFIFFVNVLSVNSSETFATNYVLVALSNLDWGIETCFYDGMTAYVATWLQFIFPVYVVLIVAGLVIASRYSTKIEKLTRTKVIPVIATLLLLPYNKVMIITFSGLFSYTTIHHLNSRKTEVYWAIDTNIPLFGTKHLFLFIFCALILLFVIIPINVLLLFTKSFYQFKFVSKYLKPFLDAYQAPFKDECRYLLGLELLLRVVVYMVYHFFGRQAAAIYITIILIYTAYICWLKPFKSLLKLFIYLLYIIYLGMLTILFLHYSIINMKPNEKFKVIFRIVVGVGFVEFMIIVGYHVWKDVLCHFKCFEKCYQHFKLNYLAFISHTTNQDTATESQESFNCSRNYQEYRDFFEFKVNV